MSFQSNLTAIKPQKRSAINKKCFRKLFNSNKICSVPGCSKRYEEGNSISLHRFPTNKEMKKLWQIKTKIAKKITVNYFVCSNHFTEDDFKFKNTRSNLKRNVIPSQNLPVSSINTEIKKDDSRARRLNDRTQKRLVQSTTTQDFNEMSDSTIIDNTTQQNSVCNITTQTNITQMQDVSLQTNMLHEELILAVPTTIVDLLRTPKMFRAMTSVDSMNEVGVIEQAIMNISGFLHFDKNLFPLREKILLVLIKLKQNSDFVVLGIYFNISPQTASRWFYTVLPILRHALKSVIYWPCQDEIERNMPKCFYPNFKNTRAVLDCTEIEIEKSSCLGCKIATYSHYKGTNTVKFLIVSSPAGMITHISAGYMGKCSDKFIFMNENILSKLEPNDAVMVDKGFLIGQELSENGIVMHRPFFAHAGEQFPADEAEQNTSIASARVHVERVIQRLKVYKILQTKLDHNLKDCIDNIMFVIACLVNLSPPILADDKF